MSRLSTGILALDKLLGGGHWPGWLTGVVGATGIAKTQLGDHFAQSGASQEGRHGIIFDITARGDSQSHAEYAKRMFDWSLQAADATSQVRLDDFFNPDNKIGNFLHVFDRRGKRVTRGELDFDAWHEWRGELNARLNATVAFFY